MARRRRPPRPGALTELPPLRILSQIAALQALFYLAQLVLTVFSCMAAGARFSGDMVLGWEPVRGDTTQGWLMALLWVLDGGVFMALAIVFIVVRSKLVLDFALTLHFIHLLVVSFYTGCLPRHAAWWAAMAASSALCVALGVWGCRYRELRPIAFGGHAAGAAAGAASGPGGNGEGGSVHAGAAGDGAPGDEEQGFSRGRGRGRGRDGAGDYEMVKLNGDAAP